MKIPLSLSRLSLFVWFKSTPWEREFRLPSPLLLDPPPDPPPNPPSLQLFGKVLLVLVLSEHLLLVAVGGNSVGYNWGTSRKLNSSCWTIARFRYSRKKAVGWNANWRSEFSLCPLCPCRSSIPQHQGLLLPRRALKGFSVPSWGSVIQYASVLWTYTAIRNLL